MQWVVSAAAGPLEIARRELTKPPITLPFEAPLATEESSTPPRTPSVVQAVPGGLPNRDEGYGEAALGALGVSGWDLSKLSRP